MLINKIQIILLVLLCTTISALAQKQTDITLLPVMAKASNKEVSESARSILLNKVNDAITAQGHASAGQSRFIVLVDPQAIDKQNNGQNLIITYNLQFSVTDLMMDRTYSSFTVQMGGVGKSADQALVDAVRRLDLSKNRLTANLGLAVADIQKYFNVNCKDILEKSKLYLAAKQYDDALANLSFLPDMPNLSCKSEHNNLLQNVLKQYTGYKCEAQITEAKKEWSLNPTISGAKSVAVILSGITLSADCKKEFDDLLNAIKAKLEREQFDEKEFTKMVFKAKVDLKRDMILASRDIALAYYENKFYKDYYYNRLDY